MIAQQLSIRCQLRRRPAHRPLQWLDVHKPRPALLAMPSIGAVIMLLLAASCWGQPPRQRYLADLTSPVSAVRAHAAAALGRAADKDAVPALIEALRDPEPLVRRQAAQSLGMIRDSRACAALVQALDDPDVNVRFFAAAALGQLGQRQAVPGLLRALGDAQWCVRDQAAWALARMPTPLPLKPLLQMLQQQNVDMDHVAWLMRQRVDQQLIDGLSGVLTSGPPLARRRAMAILQQLPGPEATQALIHACEHADAAVRLAALQSLADRREPEVARAVKRLLQQEQDEQVRQAAEAVLQQWSPKRDLVAWWSFDQPDPQRAVDVTGRGSDGEIIGCKPAPGKIGQALRFGRGQYVELGKPQSASIGRTPLTVAAWIYAEADTGVVVARGGAACGLSLYLLDGTARFAIRRSQEEPPVIAVARKNVLGRWVHLAGVVKPDRLEIYVDGQLAGVARSGGLLPGNGGQGMEIGYDVANSPAETTAFFQGLIDEVQLYHAALSPAQIAELACADQASGGAATPTGPRNKTTEKP